MVKTKTAKNQRLDREAWIEIALETLTTESIDAVLVVPLAKKLGVTKGSFYWHFKSRDELLHAALEEWRTRATRQVIQYLELKFDSPESKLRELFRIAVESKYHRYEGQVEMAIRDWARLDPVARKVVAKADQERIEYLAAQYRTLGFDEDESKTRAILQTSFSSGNGIVFGLGSEKQRLAYAQQCFEIILGQ